MRLYIGIVKAVAALVLAVAMTTVTAIATPLPSTPPEIDSTPASHEAEPEDFREPPATQPQVVSMPEQPTKPVDPPRQPPQPDIPVGGGGVDTGSILLIGCTIWYLVTIVGVAGGRRGTARQKNNGKL